MNQEQQPEALRLADALDMRGTWVSENSYKAAAELRRLHARVLELEAQVQRAAEVERAVILERVKNRAVAGALLVEDFRSIVADRGPAAPGQRAPLTDEQWTKIWAEWFDSDQDAEDLIRAIERAHGIGKEQP